MGIFLPLYLSVLPQLPYWLHTLISMADSLMKGKDGDPGKPPQLLTLLYHLQSLACNIPELEEGEDPL